MSTIKAVVRNGHIETEEPLDLPEGTELLSPIPDRSGDDEMRWGRQPGGHRGLAGSRADYPQAARPRSSGKSPKPKTG